MAVVYLHLESLGDGHTIKLDLRGDAPVTVGQALTAFVREYSPASGATLEAHAIALQTEAGRLLRPEWVLPCGEAPRADLFVVPSTNAVVTGNSSADAAGSGSQQALSVAQVDAIRASQAKMGDNSYYYAVNKNLGNTITPLEPNVPRAIAALSHSHLVREQTIASYAMMDGEAKVKVNIPLAGAKSLPSNGIAVGFFDRSFKLKIRPDANTELSLNVPLLLERIEPAQCSVKVLDGRIVLHLVKREVDKIWYELRKTKGVGDSEYDKLVPWEGKLVVVTAGGSGAELPSEAAPVCLTGPPGKLR